MENAAAGRKQKSMDTSKIVKNRNVKRCFGGVYDVCNLRFRYSRHFYK